MQTWNAEYNGDYNGLKLGDTVFIDEPTIREIYREHADKIIARINSHIGNIDRPYYIDRLEYGDVSLRNDSGNIFKWIYYECLTRDKPNKTDISFGIDLEKFL